MLRGVLESQAPPKQNATDTINTFSNRLVNATLLEDRRQAILGLRSFAKEYPASVASGALKHLIGSLAKDVDDIDTGKIILETLLMLFHPNENSPEASDDISLWLADEFSQRQDNITVLLDLLEKADFYSSLYSLQLLSAISNARPERTQDCILAAPLGTAKLVASLDDPREPVRSAALLLLNEVTQNSFELQKIVAFENAFDRIFNLICVDGSLNHGGILVQDCLALLANLLELNSSNQSLFRETGFVAKLAGLFVGDEKDDEEPGEEPSNANTNKDKNLWGVLAVLRMFLVKGSLGTQANQAAFEKHGVLQIVLNLGFSPSVGIPIKGEALRTCADLIRGNSKIQEKFAFNTVSVSPTNISNGEAKGQANGTIESYVIDALLDLALSVSAYPLFDVRYAACECIEAYFENHRPIRLHFLDRAIQGHKSGEDETSNILSILIGGPRSYQWIDPYRIWFAALLVRMLILDDNEAKKILRQVSEGDEAQGEEVVTCIQAMTGNLIAAIQDGEDERISIGYAELLCVWAFEDTESVSDILSEGSTVQSMIQIASKKAKGREITQGLCAVLLGSCYEFSTKDSPIPRRKLQPMLMGHPGREQYLQKIARLREHPALRDFEVLPQNLTSTPPGSIPEVYFDQAFVDFIKDNFSRFTRALDRDPGIEVVHAHEGIDRDLVDALRAQIEDKKEALEKSELRLVDLDSKLSQAQADNRKSQETSSAEVTRIKNINEALHKSHDAEVERLESKHHTEVRNLRDQHSRQTGNATAQAQRSLEEASKRAKADEEQYKSEVKRWVKQQADLEKKTKTMEQKIELLEQSDHRNEQIIKQRDSQIESLKDAKQVLEESIELNTVNVRRLEDQIREYEARAKELRDSEAKLQTEVASREESRASAQSELDDLLMVLGDLEEKRARDKAKLKELGAETSDVDDDGDEEDGEDEEEDDGPENFGAKDGSGEDGARDAANGQDEGEEDEEEGDEEEDEEDDESTGAADEVMKNERNPQANVNGATKGRNVLGHVQQKGKHKNAGSDSSVD